MRQQDTAHKARLKRMVVLGLIAGTAGFIGVPNAAEATTLSEYKALLELSNRSSKDKQELLSHANLINASGGLLLTEKEHGTKAFNTGEDSVNSYNGILIRGAEATLDGRNIVTAPTANTGYKGAATILIDDGIVKDEYGNSKTAKVTINNLTAYGSANETILIGAGELTLNGVVDIKSSPLAAINVTDNSVLNLNLAKGSKIEGAISATGGNGDAGVINITTDEYFDLDAKGGYFQLGGLMPGESIEDRQNHTAGVINLNSGKFKNDTLVPVEGGGKVSINEGATLVRKTPFAAIPGSYNYSVAGIYKDINNPLHLNGGTLETVSKNVFTAPLTTGTETAADAVLQTANDYVYFQKGTVKLTDDKYTLAWVQNAKNLLDAADSSHGPIDVRLSMTGTLVDATGKADITQKFDDVRDLLKTNVFLDNTLINADTTDFTLKNDSNTYSIAILNLEKSAINQPSTITLDGWNSDSSNATIAKPTLTLSRSAGGELVTVNKVSPTTDVAISITRGGTLALNDINSSGAAMRTKADITLTNSNYLLNQSYSDTTRKAFEEGGNLTVTGNHTVSSLTAKGGSTITINKGSSLKATEGITLVPNVIQGTFNGTHYDSTDNNPTLNVNGTLKDTKLTSTGADIIIGSNDPNDPDNENTNSAGHVYLDENSSLTGSTVFLDPAWKDGVGLSGASSLTFTSDNVDYRLTIGQNSIVALSDGTKPANTTDATWAAANKYFELSRQEWSDSDITAALYLADSIEIGSATGAVIVDGSLTTPPSPLLPAKSATFSANSLLIVNALGLEDDSSATYPSITPDTVSAAAITSTAGTLTVNADANLYLANAHAGNTYTIANGFTQDADSDGIADSTVNGWQSGAGNLNDGNLFTNLLTKGTLDTSKTGDLTSGTTKVIVTQVNAREAMPNAAIPNILDTMIGKKLNRTESAKVDINFLSNAIEGEKTAYNIAKATRLINIAANGAEVVGATSNALGTMNSFANDVAGHLSLLTDAASAHGQDVWAKYIRNTFDVSGQKLAGLDTDYKNNYNGIIAGADLFESKNKNTRLGVALSYSEGSTSSIFGSNKNESYGVALYGGFHNKNNTNLIVDIGYGKTDNDVKGLINSSPSSDSFTLGLRAEQLIKQKNFTIIPHIGLRYTGIDSGDYTGTINGSAAFHYQTERANVFSMPIGIGIHSDSKTSNGWHYKTQFDISYIPTFGDKEANMHVRAANIPNAFDRLSYDIIDGNSVVASLGFNMERNNIAFGIGYSYQKGSDIDNHRLQAGFQLKF